MEGDQILTFLYPIILAIIGALGTLATLYIKILIAKGKKQLEVLQNEEDRKIAQKILRDAEEYISTAVINTNQDLVDNLKKASADGQLTEEEAYEAFEKTFTKARELMGKELQQKVSNLVPDFNEWLEAKIKVQVAYNK